MVTYNLEETPNIFISISNYNNKFLYQMVQLEGDHRKPVRKIDLRNDTLRIYGSEIQDSMFQKLYDSLTLRKKSGIIYVNCDGSWYIIEQQGCVFLRPIHDVIFDWSPFGVTVPDSVHDSLSKQLAQRDATIDVLNRELASAKANLEALQGELCKSKDENRDMGVELKKVNDELCHVNFVLGSTKDRLESTNKNVKELEGRISTSENNCLEMEARLHKMRDELCVANGQLFFTKIGIESMKNRLKVSNNEVRELKEQIFGLEEIKTEMEAKLHKGWERVTLIEFEVELYKIELESCKKEADEFLDEICNYKEELQNKICMEEQLKSSRKEVEQLKDEIKSYVMENKYLEVELHKISDQISSVNFEVKSGKQKSDQLLNSELWNLVTRTLVPCLRCGHRTYHFRSFEDIEFRPCTTLEITQEIDIQ